MQVFSPLLFSGFWYEVSSIKPNIVPYIQQHCRNTKTLFIYDNSNPSKSILHTQTACTDFDNTVKTTLEAEISCNNISSSKSSMKSSTKCIISYPSQPFVPQSEYKILNTDYSTYAIVATNTYNNKINSSSIIQIYARVPYPGAKFITTYKNTLYKLFNYNYKNNNEFYDTPQDLACIAIPPE